MNIWFCDCICVIVMFGYDDGNYSIYIVIVRFIRIFNNIRFIVDGFNGRSGNDDVGYDFGSYSSSPNDIFLSDSSIIAMILDSMYSVMDSLVMLSLD